MPRQDLMLKLHYQHTKRNLHLINDSNRWVYDIVEKYNDSFKKNKNKYEEKKVRYQVKKILFKKLLSLDKEQVFSPSIGIVIEILNKYWSVKKRDFVMDGKTGDKVASHILDELIDSLVRITKLTKIATEDKSLLFKTPQSKKDILDDVFKLQKINSA